MYNVQILTVLRAACAMWDAETEWLKKAGEHYAGNEESLPILINMKGWPEPYIYTVYDCLFVYLVDILPKKPYIHRIYMVLANLINMS